MKAQLFIVLCALLLAHPNAVWANIIKIDYGFSNAKNAENALLTSLTSYTTETFDNIGMDRDLDNLLDATTGETSGAGFLYGNNQFVTAVGTFIQMQADGTNTNEGKTLNWLLLESNRTGEHGRQMPFASNWLDSNDSDSITWLFDGIAGANAFGFYLSDANDQGARLQLLLSDNSVANLTLDRGLSNGNIAYVSFIGQSSLIGAALTFNNFDARGRSTNDGFGIDNVTVGIKVPEPSTLGFLTFAIAALLVYRKFIPR